MPIAKPQPQPKRPASKSWRVKPHIEPRRDQTAPAAQNPAACVTRRQLEDRAEAARLKRELTDDWADDDALDPTDLAFLGL